MVSKNDTFRNRFSVVLRWSVVPDQYDNLTWTLGEGLALALAQVQAPPPPADLFPPATSGPAKHRSGTLPASSLHPSRSPAPSSPTLFPRRSSSPALPLFLSRSRAAAPGRTGALQSSLPAANRPASPLLPPPLWRRRISSVGDLDRGGGARSGLSAIVLQGGAASAARRACGVDGSGCPR